MSWVETRDRRHYGIDFIKEAEERVQIIQQHIATAQSHYKSYADKRRRPLEFEVGDHVYLKVSPMKRVQRFGVKRKLAPRYVGPYQIIEKKGSVAYKLKLSEEMKAVFLVFHVSQLKKCLRVPAEKVKARDVVLRSDLTYEEEPTRLLDVKERVTRNRVVKQYKVSWGNHDEPDATWETEAYLKETYPEFHKKWLVYLNLGTRFL